MLQVAQQLRRAGGVDAVPIHLSGHVLDRLFAHRADLRRFEDALAAIPDLHHRADHVGDHVAGAFEHHPVAYANIFLGDVIEIVQGGLFDDHPADLDRFEGGRGHQAAGAPHVDPNID